MKLTTKRNRWYFWKELFLYMIPMILIVGTVDVFYHFVQCPLHPENSAPCNVNWFLAVAYWCFLLITIIFAIIASKMLKNIKKQIEDDFFSSIKSEENNPNIIEHDEENEEMDSKKYHKRKGTMKMIEENKHEEDDNFEKWVKSKTKKVRSRSTKTKKESVKKEIAKK